MILSVVVPCALGLAQPGPGNPGEADGPGARGRMGPWNNDVVIYRVAAGGGGPAERLGTISRAGVSTLARLADGRIAAAFQHFPENDPARFDRVAVCFSTDEGRTWTEPEPVIVDGFPEGLMRPFDPTLVPLPAPDGRVRLYFTSNRMGDNGPGVPEIYSAISSNGVRYAFEPGVRFGLTGRTVIDCAVAWHEGMFHLFAPDNGEASTRRDGSPRVREGEPGRGYHAVSRDGLQFNRQPDVRLDGDRRWLGNAQSEGAGLRFFGTGGGLWTATSVDGADWTVDESFPAVPGADPGAVRLKDGGWLLAVTGPPRDGRRMAGGPGGFGPGAGPGPGPGDGMAPGRMRRAPQNPVLHALDANSDGTIDEWELTNAAALLRRLDRNEDGRLTPDEYRPMGMGGGFGGPGQGPQGGPGAGPGRDPGFGPGRERERPERPPEGGRPEGEPRR